MTPQQRLKGLSPNLCNRYAAIRRRYSGQWLHLTIQGVGGRISEKFEADLLDLMKEAVGQAKALGAIKSDLNHDEQHVFGFVGQDVDLRMDRIRDDLVKLSDTMMYLNERPAECPLRAARVRLNRALRQHVSDH